jgi:hypothetical protein
MLFQSGRARHMVCSTTRVVGEQPPGLTCRRCNMGGYGVTGKQGAKSRTRSGSPAARATRTCTARPAGSGGCCWAPGVREGRRAVQRPGYLSVRALLEELGYFILGCNRGGIAGWALQTQERESEREREREEKGGREGRWKMKGDTARCRPR